VTKKSKKKSKKSTKSKKSKKSKAAAADEEDGATGKKKKRYSGPTWKCDVVKPIKGPWRTGLNASHFWDCNGAGCDATTLQPYSAEKFLYASQYGPADPNDFGGPVYNESLWLTGAASDTLAHMLASDQGLNESEYYCGLDEQSPGCGKCLLVQNLKAVNKDWYAVIMKKSRCPPESKGCEPGNVHMDVAVPGYDVLSESTANVCGTKDHQDTFIDDEQASSCGMWFKEAKDTATGCDCSGLPDSNKQERVLKRGCELFSAWGWKSGKPELRYRPVDCPEEFSKRISESFTRAGMTPVEKPNYIGLISFLSLIIICICGTVGVLNWYANKAEKKKREELRKQLAEKKRRKRQNLETWGTTNLDRDDASSMSSIS